MPDVQDELKLETLPAGATPETDETALEPFTGDSMEVLIEVAAHVAQYEKALDTIMNFIVKRTYAGDWVSHDKANTPLEDRTVNPSGAAMERVARDLGIQEIGRTSPVKHMHGEKHPGHYYYQCEASFEFRGRRIKAIGLASTLNPFYYKKGETTKEPHDIREEYIIRDCLRDCVKQGVKGLFGLRKIPVMKLKELGYDISKIKYVNFQSGAQSAAAKNPEATAVPAGAEKPIVDGEQVTMTIEAMDAKVSKKGSPFYHVTDAEGAKYYAWGTGSSEKIQKLMMAFQKKQTITVMVKLGEYPTIESVVS